MKSFILSVLFLVYAQTVGAQTTANEEILENKNPQVEESKNPEGFLDKTKKSAEAASQTIIEKLNETKERRASNKYLALLSYSAFDLIIPSKIGLSLGYMPDVDRTWELEYLKGSIAVPFLVEDLGSMNDERISLIKRSYLGTNSFNINYGLTYFRFNLHLGDEILNRLSSGVYPSVDLVNIETLGFNIGIGNRWSFNKNITVSVDWVSLSQPIYVWKKDSAFLTYASNENDRENVDDLIRIVSYFPRFQIFKFQVGILF